MAIFGEEGNTEYMYLAEDPDWRVDPFDDRSWVRSLLLIAVVLLVVFVLHAHGGAR